MIEVALLTRVSSIGYYPVRTCIHNNKRGVEIAAFLISEVGGFLPPMAYRPFLFPFFPANATTQV